MKKLLKKILAPLLRPIRRLRLLVITRKYSPGWKVGDGKVDRREYNSYDDYISHQKTKFKFVDGSLSLETDYDRKFSEALAERLKKIDRVGNGANVLCLGARFGTEVHTFIARNCFAVGIDLMPPANSKYVVHGDFHNLQFDDNSIDIIFSNSLDHALDIEKTAREIYRVLKPGGMFILEAVVTKYIDSRDWEATWWVETDDLADIFTSNGFVLANKVPFEIPWNGDHFQLLKKDGQ